MRLLRDEKGVVHFGLAIFAIIGIFFIFLCVSIKRNNEAIPVADPQPATTFGEPAAEQVRHIAYAAIDIQAEVAKFKVDLALETWDSIDPEIKEAALARMMELFKRNQASMDSLSPNLSQNGSFSDGR